MDLEIWKGVLKAESSRRRKQQVLEDGPILDPPVWLEDRDLSGHWGGPQGLDFVRFVFCVFGLVLDSGSDTVQCLSFSTWLVSLSTRPPRSICVATNGRMSSFSMAKRYSSRVYATFSCSFIHWQTLGCFHHSASGNNAAMNVALQTALRHSVPISFLVF